MRTAAIVPINALGQAKSRLRPLLDPRDRRRLVFWLAAHVVQTLQATPEVTAVYLVSPDDEVLAWARELGVVPVRQHEGDLNTGLELARTQVLLTKADTVLVALGDLPLLAPADVSALLAALGPESGSAAVALAPDRAGAGTNLLAARPAGALPFAFGLHSLARHEHRARALHVEPIRLTTESTGFDVDEPDDVRQLIAMGLWHPQHSAVASERNQACSA